MSETETEDFECHVKGTTGVIDIVLFTELILPLDLWIWKADEAWTGKLVTAHDWATLEVEWQDGTKNIVEIKDVRPTNTSDFIGLKVVWRPDGTEGVIFDHTVEQFSSLETDTQPDRLRFDDLRNRYDTQGDSSWDPSDYEPLLPPTEQQVRLVILHNFYLSIGKAC